MGARETTPATSYHRGKDQQATPRKTTQPEGQKEGPGSPPPITGRRLAASSSFVHARALQPPAPGAPA